MHEQAALAHQLWRARKPALGSIVETYIRKARNYHGAIPATLGFLPANGRHPPAMIAAFAMAVETTPGALKVDADAVRAVHLTRLLPDGSGKVEDAPAKIMIGRGAQGTPIAIAPPNDLLGLAVTEGIEDGVSVFEATGLGVWAAGGAGRMPALAEAVPSYIECVSVIGHDDGGRGCADELVIRLRQRGIRAVLKILRRADA